MIAVRDLPHAGDHAASIARQMERGKQPRTLGGLLAWFDRILREETPDKLHVMEPWHDRVSIHEHTTPVGGSLLGSLAWSGTFRALMEASPSATDEDGYYFTPARAALSRLYRRQPFMARFLFRLAQSGGNWQRIADELGYEHEFIETYTDACLRRFWREYAERAGRAG